MSREPRRSNRSTSIRRASSIPVCSSSASTAALTFLTADGLADGRDEASAGRCTGTGIVIDFAGVNFIDSQGSDQLRQLVELSRGPMTSLRLARVRGDVLAVLRADGVVALLGEERLHGNVDQAVRAELASVERPGEPGR